MCGNVRLQVFTIEIETKERDGCSNYIPPLTEGDVRKALMKGLDNYDSITVEKRFTDKWSAHR